MANRLSLPQQRAAETRRRILDAAYGVFAGRGYGQTSVEDIIAEAGISRGAFYHHFSGKDELFKALLDDHVERGLIEFGELDHATSLRDVIDRFVAIQVGDMKAHAESGSLSFEFMAEAAREKWARTAFAQFHRRTHGVIAAVVRAGQSAGVIRADLDPESAAWLLLSIFEGLSALNALDPTINVDELQRPWADLIDRFVRSHKEEGHAEGA